jgi:hypothetical protein
MFGKMGDMMKQMQMMQKLMKDDNFKAFISHPKMQELIKDPEFMQLMKKQDMPALQKHARFGAIMKDPEILGLIQKIDFKKLMS